MPVRVNPAARGTARGRWLADALCREIDTARIDRGLSLATLGRAIGLSGQQVGRLLRTGSTRLTILRAAQLCELVGLQLSARAFASGQPIRDGPHVALLDRLRARLSPRLEWRAEVPVVARSGAGRPDMRAWDATITGPGWAFGVEAETNVRDLQAIDALKVRDGSVDGILLVLSETRHHRDVLSASPNLRDGFPTSARIALLHLRRGERPPGSALLML